ncbi:MAG: hypothetical protein DLM59_01270 [Pseudonocardiales bacterium]|nr:MAG: hypothetical protein DLM59_01270 [Pseudonocardiales bacterium]
MSALAERRATAREARDFATADLLRAEIAEAGWAVADRPDGFDLTIRPPYDVVPSVNDLPDHAGDPDTHRASVAVVVDGWPDDLAAFAAAVLQHAPPDVVLLALDVDNRDGAGDVLHALANSHPGRVVEFHVERSTGWAAAVAALARADRAAVHVLADLSTIFDGDALTPLLTALEDPAVVGAGWRGVRVSNDWLSFEDAPAGEVEAVLGYLFAVRRRALLEVPPHPKARFYRNADMELSFALRQAGLGRLVVPAVDLPVHQARHRGYHDSDPTLRDKESKRNYDRFLQRFRGRDELRLPGGQSSGAR